MALALHTQAEYTITWGGFMAEAARKMADNAEKKQNQDASKAPVSKRDWLGLASALMVVINIAAVGSLGLVLKKLWNRLHLIEAKVEEVALIQKEESLPLEQAKKSGRSLTPPVAGTLYPLESFLVNISSDQGPKFLQAQMELELMDSTTEDEITKKKAAIRDAVLVLLSSKSYREIREPSGMINLRKDILRSINGLLNSGKVKELYFTQFHFN